MEIKQCTKINNQGVKRNKKTPWDKYKWKYIYQNLWNAAKVVFKGKFIDINTYIKKEPWQIYNLTFYLKRFLKKGKQTEPK